MSYKLLSIFLARYTEHDANISYYDGKKIHYLHLGRITRIKHYHFSKNCSILHTLKNVEKLIKYKWNISLKDLDSFTICDTLKDNEILEVNTEYKNAFVQKADPNKTHHYYHALSIDMFRKADITIIIDGRGDDVWWSVFENNIQVGKGNIYESGGSIGTGLQILASSFSIKGHPQDLAGKMMGLQSYGSLNEDYSQILRDKYSYERIGKKSEKRIPEKVLRDSGYDLFKMEESNIKKRLDLAKTIHTRAGELVLDIFSKYAKKTQLINYAGGVAHNVIWNTELKKKYPNLEILPHCGDDGISLGGLELLRNRYNLDRFFISKFPFIQDDESPSSCPSKNTIQQVAKYLLEGNVVAWYQDNGELGKRALGNRSILLDPRIKNGKNIINKVKNREFYRPFGASILEEFAKEWFDLDFKNPYMLYVGNTQKKELDAITHIDGTCRVQTVMKDDNNSFRKLLEEFYKQSSCPVLLNTSLNISGSDITFYVDDAFKQFSKTSIDILVVGDKIYRK